MKRRADPYRDLDVIDAWAPRFNQATIGALALVSFLTGWWPLLPLLAAQLAIGLAFGRRYCLPCLAYFELVQPQLGEGPLEDARPNRFANLVGAISLGAASVAHVAGLSSLGWALALAVAALALLAAVSGVCLGCEMYRLGARWRGMRSHRLKRVELADVGLDGAGAAPLEGSIGDIVVEFTHPLCTDCRELERKLAAAGRRVVTVDVSKRPELARKYGVALVPTAVAVTAGGRVTRVLAP